MNETSSIPVAGIVLAFLFGVILLGVGFFRSRIETRRELKALREEIEKLKSSRN